jgi:hypothetical protein
MNVKAFKTFGDLAEHFIKCQNDVGLYICGFNTASHYTKKIMLKHSLDTVVSCYDEKNSIAC